MHRINCPHCGVRDEIEFHYRGDATVRRPAVAADGTADAGQFYDYLHKRENPKGWHVEWWHHVGGCRQFIKVVRHTVTHEIAATGRAGDVLVKPADAPKAAGGAT